MGVIRFIKPLSQKICNYYCVPHGTNLKQRVIIMSSSVVVTANLKRNINGDGNDNTTKSEYRRRRTDLDAPPKEEIDNYILLILNQKDYLHFGAITSQLASYIGISKEWCRQRLNYLLKQGKVKRRKVDNFYLWYSSKKTLI